MLPGAFPDIYKVTPDIDFTDEVIVQYYVPVVAGNLQVITNKF